MTMDELDQLAEQSPAEQSSNEPQDIDPAEWLSKATTEVLTDTVITKAGKLKIAALTEKEADEARKLAERIDPKNPRGAKILSLTRMRCATVAASLNKAYGYTPGHPNFMLPEKLYIALSGEITMINNRIAQLSGFVEDQSTGPEAIFQVS